ncbi:MAG: S8 family serine peptidase [Chloroflexaceae bacterium]
MSCKLSSRLTHIRLFLVLLVCCTGLLASQFPMTAVAEPQKSQLPISPVVLQTAEEIQQGTGAGLQATDPRPGTVRVNSQGEIGVEVRITGTPAAAAAAFAAAGIRVGTWSEPYPLVSAWVQPEQLDTLAALPMVMYVGPMLMPVVRSGTVVTEGDTILGAEQARTEFGLSGRGIRIGVISDGVEGLDIGQAANELPPDCPANLTDLSPSCVLVDADNAGFRNEGRAMLEIIHDLAPDAILGFSSGIDGVMGFVDAINFLQEDFAADIIVDDIGYLTEPYFENGTIGTRAQQAVDAGVVFVSAAGNDGENHYQATLDITDDCQFGVEGGCLHRFAANDTSLSFSLPRFSSIQVILQWNNPFSNTTTAARNALDDLDLYLVEGNTKLASSKEIQSVSGIPIEILIYQNSSDSTQQVDLAVDAYALNSGTTPQIEMLLYAFSGNRRIDLTYEHTTAADSIYGHPGMPGVIGVGAVDSWSPTEIQSYSSQGPVTIRGESTPRSKPDIVATDCVATSTPGFSNFCGTSAAAPHVAALAALLLEEEPDVPPWRIRSLLKRRAVDLGPAGFDTIYGAGRANVVNSINESRFGPQIFHLMLPLIQR